MKCGDFSNTNNGERINASWLAEAFHIHIFYFLVVNYWMGGVVQWEEFGLWSKNNV